MFSHSLPYRSQYAVYLGHQRNRLALLGIRSALNASRIVWAHSPAREKGKSSNLHTHLSRQIETHFKHIRVLKKLHPPYL